MAVYTPVSDRALSEFLARFDVGSLVSAKGIAEGVENSNYLVDTTGGRFILTLYEKRVSEGDLPYFIALLDHLAVKRLPVPPAIADRDGREIHQLCARPACLIRFLPGVSLSHPTPVQAHAAGAALARMHLAAADFPERRANSMGVDSWAPLLERCGCSLDRIEPRLYDDAKRLLDEVLRRWPRELPVATIHADLFPDNVLVLGERITGIIDFYFACTDLRAYDLAVMHSAWAFDITGAPLTEPVGEALIAGYRSVAPLDPAEIAALPVLALGACVRFFLSRAWDWLNTPPDALVTRKDPLAYWRRIEAYREGRMTLA